MKQFVFRFIQGALIGTGAILPGVSGGMLCLMFGVYEPILSLISRPVSAFREQRRLFLPLMLGGLLGFFALAGCVEWAFDRDSAAASCLFLGLIAGSLPPLVEDAGNTRTHRSFFIGSLLCMLALMACARSFALTVQPNAPWFLFCGAVWGLSLVLPGLSSSALLIFLGLYQPMTAGIAALDLRCILPVGTGIALTILICAPLVRRLLKSHRGAMLNAVLGAMCASAIMILPTEYLSLMHGALCLFCALSGFLCALILERMRRNAD